MGGVLLCAAVGWGLRSHYRNRPRPADLERRRRAMLTVYGKMGDASIIQADGAVAIYSYLVRGVEYTASQDLSGLQVRLPPDPWSMIGPASVKYDPRNPANSIVVSEKWTGIHPSPAADNR